MIPVSPMPKLPTPKVAAKSVARIAKAARTVTGIAKTVTCPVKIRAAGTVTCPVKIRAAGVVAMVVASESSK
jgi:hypothetical protein